MGGKCDACGAWNSLWKRRLSDRRIGGSAKAHPPSAHPPIRRGRVSHRALEDGLAEFDFVLGGGIVPAPSSSSAASRHRQVHAPDAVRREAREPGVSTLYVFGRRVAGPAAAARRSPGRDAATFTCSERHGSSPSFHHATQLEIETSCCSTRADHYTRSSKAAPGNVGQVRECAAG